MGVGTVQDRGGVQELYVDAMTCVDVRLDRKSGGSGVRECRSWQPVDGVLVPGAEA